MRPDLAITRARYCYALARFVITDNSVITDLIITDTVLFLIPHYNLYPLITDTYLQLMHFIIDTVITVSSVLIYTEAFNG